MRWFVRRSVVLVLLALMGTAVVPPPALHAQEQVLLVAGCNNVALLFAAGTPMGVVAGQIQPPSALQSIFRYDGSTGRFVAYSPVAPATVNDYLVVDRRLEPVFICMSAPGFLLAGPALVVPPVVTESVGVRGVLSAPARLVRGQPAEVVIGTAPNIACTGGINIPAGATFRFVSIAQGSTPSGTLVFRFDVLTTDDPAFAFLAIRCADGQTIRLTFPVV